MSTLTALDGPGHLTGPRLSGPTVSGRGAVGPTPVGGCRPSAVAIPASGDGERGDRFSRPQLTLVPERPSRATYWRRRCLAVVGLLAAALVLALVVGQMVAAADLESRVDGHVVVEPGETLWDIAAATAPDGVDARQHLAAIEDLNGIRAGDLRAWNVVLLPAR